MKKSAYNSLYNVVKDIAEKLAAINYDCSVARVLSTSNDDIIVTVKGKTDVPNIQLKFGYDNTKYYVLITDEAEIRHTCESEFLRALEIIHLFLSKSITGYDIKVARGGDTLKYYLAYTTRDLDDLAELFNIALQQDSKSVMIHNYEAEIKRLKLRLIMTAVIDLIADVIWIYYSYKKRKEK